jgi:hypothetical protein
MVVRYGNSPSADRQPNTDGVIETEDSGVTRRAAAVESSDHRRPSQLAGNGAARASGARGQAQGIATEVVTVRVLSLRPADSPRLNGEDKAHIARLAEIETTLPPIRHVAAGGVNVLIVPSAA